MTSVGISAYVARLRSAVGQDVLLLPSVSVLVLDAGGRLLLVHHAGHDDGWAVLGGAVEVGESPAEAAVREAHEEIGVRVRLRRLLAVLGGSDYEVTYPNGDRVAYVTASFEAEIVDGTPVADQDELDAVAWFRPDELPAVRLNQFARALLGDAGYL